MRSFTLALAAVVLLAAAPARAESPSIGDKPWTVGLLLGASVTGGGILGTVGAFSMEIPIEYDIKVGPGYLAPHFGFMVGAGAGGAASIGLPMGLRYKIPVASFPLYVYPMFDIGPAFFFPGGSAWGALRVGGGLSYLVHPYVELVFQPLGLGALFCSAGGAFWWNMLLGVQAHF
jgi:hypothetical protein